MQIVTIIKIEQLSKSLLFIDRLSKDLKKNSNNSRKLITKAIAIAELVNEIAYYQNKIINKLQ